MIFCFVFTRKTLTQGTRELTSLDTCFFLHFFFFVLFSIWSCFLYFFCCFSKDYFVVFCFVFLIFFTGQFQGRKSGKLKKSWRLYCLCTRFLNGWRFHPCFSHDKNVSRFSAALISFLAILRSHVRETLRTNSVLPSGSDRRGGLLGGGDVDAPWSISLGQLLLLERISWHTSITHTFWFRAFAVANRLWSPLTRRLNNAEIFYRLEFR